MSKSDADDGESNRAALREILSEVDPHSLTRVELLLMANVLGAALTSFGDPPADLGDQQIV